MAGLDRLEIMILNGAARTAIAQRARTAGLGIEAEGDARVLRDLQGTVVALVAG